MINMRRVHVMILELQKGLLYQVGLAMQQFRKVAKIQVARVSGIFQWGGREKFEEVVHRADYSNRARFWGFLGLEATAHVMGSSQSITGTRIWQICCLVASSWTWKYYVLSKRKFLSSQTMLNTPTQVRLMVCVVSCETCRSSCIARLPATSGTCPDRPPGWGTPA